MIRFAAALFAMALTLTPAAAADKMTVLLDWFVNPDHAPLIVAKEKGFFAKHGLEVELVEPADPNLPPKLVAAGQGDIAVTYQPNLYLQIQEGLPLTRIGGVVDTPLNCLVALEGGSITSLKDLKGKKIGYSISGFEDALLGMMLENNGLKASDVEMINVNFALTPALMSKQVDAVIGAFRNFELTQIKLAGGKGLAFFPEEHGVPLYDELIYVAKNDRVKDPKIKKFLAAIQEATIFLINHPDDSWGAFIKAYPKLDDELNKTAWAQTLPRFAKTPASLDKTRYENFGDFMKERGLIKSVPDISTFTTEIR
ncbi:ABC transporter ATP-binding protein [Terrihabitans soli]|uniref:ABC transporter ATP-binding protein n=1 Tax=Terrihabitans soli TaxID=708113 RepID=A0A6S6QV06_9HYPH|nr:ABC transporter substrate-binding protein [Terrihabitans soli]BCJ90931.1 ABC transporter ATP-binding protein [Terrihabitans soli]